MKKPRVVRIVVPARDFDKVKDIVNKLKEKSQNYIHTTIKLFEVRPDLDSIEYTFIVTLSQHEVRELSLLLSKRLSGTIGFFIIYDYKT